MLLCVTNVFLCTAAVAGTAVCSACKPEVPVTAQIMSITATYCSVFRRLNQTTSGTLQGVASKDNKAASWCMDINPTPMLVLYLKGKAPTAC